MRLKGMRLSGQRLIGMRPNGMRPNGMRSDGMRLKGYGSRERGLSECGPTEWIRSVGDGGDASPPTFQLGGDHIGNIPPPLFCLKSGKSHVFLSPSNLHSFVSLRNRHRFVLRASGCVPPPSPTDLHGSIDA